MLIDSRDSVGKEQVVAGDSDGIISYNGTTIGLGRLLGENYLLKSWYHIYQMLKILKFGKMIIISVANYNRFYLILRNDIHRGIKLDIF